MVSLFLINADISLRSKPHAGERGEGKKGITYPKGWNAKSHERLEELEKGLCRKC